MSSEIEKRSHLSSPDISTKKLSVRIDTEPCYIEESEKYHLCCFGHVYNLDQLRQFNFEECTTEQFRTLLSSLAGYFCLVFHDLVSERILAGNDYFGNFRLYYYDNGVQPVITNDWLKLSETIKDDWGEHKFIAEEQFYYGRHRYTTGGQTTVRQLKKVMPASLYEATPTGLTHKIYLPNRIKAKPDSAEYVAENHELIESNIRLGLKRETENILLFSGGVDSTYLACTMLKLKLKFRPVFVKYDPPNRDNVIDLHKASKVAKHLGLELEIITVKIAERFDLIERVARRPIFDKAMIIPLEAGFEELQKRYGKCNIVNGQASDSIYSWGASGKTTGSFIQRLVTSGIYSKRPALVRRMVAKIVERLYNDRWRSKEPLRIPYLESEYWLGLLDPQGYLPVIHTEADRTEYSEYLGRISSMIAAELEYSDSAIRMYMKLMYLQGPVDLFLVQSAEAYGHTLVMPFVDARIVDLRRSKQSEWRELWQPRYALEKSLADRFGFDVAVIDRCRGAEVDLTATKEFARLQAKVYDEWERISASLL